MDGADRVATAFGIEGDRIAFVGSRAEGEAWADGRARVVELEGRAIVPGFIDAHVHFLAGGSAIASVQLRDAQTPEEFVRRVGAFAESAEPGEWIVGRGWHQSKWDPAPDPAVRGFQIHDALSEVSPDNPVFLRHASGHASFANALAMEFAGVTADTPDPDGGEIIRDEAGQPTGIFVETASRLVSAAYSASRDSMTTEDLQAESMRALLLAQEEAFSKGVTSFQDAGVGIEIREADVPVQENVRAACELLGFDPLYVANEGRFVAFVDATNADRALELPTTDEDRAAYAEENGASEEQAGGADAAQANNPLADFVAFNVQNYYVPSLSGVDGSANTFWLRYAQPFGRWLMRASAPIQRVPVPTTVSATGSTSACGRRTRS